MIYRDQLEAVYRLIEKPENWLKRTFNNARYNVGAQGDVWRSNTPDCFCLAGAYHHVLDPARDLNMIQAKTATTELAKFLGFTNWGGQVDLFDFNDTHTHGEVLAFLQSAIDRAPVRP